MYFHPALYLIQKCIIHISIRSITINFKIFLIFFLLYRAAAERADSEQLALRTAEKLLNELKPKPNDIRAILLQNMALVATKNKANVETAIQNFMEIATAEVSQ